MSVQIPEETLKQWQNEAGESWKNSPYLPLELRAYIQGFLAAKTSSYEREQELKKIIADSDEHFEQSMGKDKEIQKLSRECSSMGKLLQSGVVYTYAEIIDRNKEILKLQVRIKELESGEAVTKIRITATEFAGDCIRLKSQLAKRDVLIEQAKVFVTERLSGVWGYTRAKEWLKQADELKEGK